MLKHKDKSTDLLAPIPSSVWCPPLWSSPSPPDSVTLTPWVVPTTTTSSPSIHEDARDACHQDRAAIETLRAAGFQLKHPIRDRVPRQGPGIRSVSRGGSKRRGSKSPGSKSPGILDSGARSGETQTMSPDLASEAEGLEGRRLPGERE